jgi:cell wall-associated NlpC family hydrolase
MRKVMAALMAAALAMTVALTVATSADTEATTVAYRAFLVARDQLGDPFKYGAEGPNRFDCSGLTWYSYKLAGRPIRRNTWGQYYISSRATQATMRQRGDLVFFLASGHPFHVGIYAGRGYVIHANSGSYCGRKVVREQISEYWSKHYWVRYRRVRVG